MLSLLSIFEPFLTGAMYFELAVKLAKMSTCQKKAKISRTLLEYVYVCYYGERMPVNSTPHTYVHTHKYQCTLLANVVERKLK